MAVTGLTDVEASGPGAMGASAPKRFVSHCHSRWIVGAGPCGAQQGFAERHRMGTFAGCYNVLKNATRSACSCAVSPMAKRML
jgi:hypothetical protein